MAIFSYSQVFNIKHMYDGKVIKMSCFPLMVAYSNGVLVVGEPSGCVKVIDISNGQCLQTFNDHKASITDIYAVSNIVYITCIVHVCATIGMYYNILLVI